VWKADILIMISHLSSVRLEDLDEEDLEEFSLALEDSWTYWLDDSETLEEYLVKARKREALIFALKMAGEWVGLLSFCYEPRRAKWLFEYVITKKRRGMGMSKLILPTVSHAFESLGKKMGLAIRGNNQIGQRAVYNALRVEFPPAEPSTLFIVDLAPWTWGHRYHISDQLVVSITTELTRHPQG
jgi:hypothetical protein